MEPDVEIILRGKIADFGRMDNVYTVIKREGSKLLKEWTLDIKVQFSESEESV